MALAIILLLIMATAGLGLLCIERLDTVALQEDMLATKSKYIEALQQRTPCSTRS